MSEHIDFTIGSDNLFADLGLPDEEAEEELLKSQLVRNLRTIIKNRGLTQVDAAGIIGIAQPNLSKLLGGCLDGFSVERIFRCITALGSDIELVVKNTAEPSKHGRVKVITE